MKPCPLEAVKSCSRSSSRFPRAGCLLPCPWTWSSQRPSAGLLLLQATAQPSVTAAVPHATLQAPRLWAWHRGNGIPLPRWPSQTQEAFPTALGLLSPVLTKAKPVRAPSLRNSWSARFSVRAVCRRVSRASPPSVSLSHRSRGDPLKAQAQSCCSPA